MYKSLALFAIAASAQASEWGQGNFAKLFGGRNVADRYESYSGFGRGFGGYGGYNYDSDGPRRSAHDKDGETYGHENSPHELTEFGEKDGPRGDDYDYGFNLGARGHGYGRGRRHQELDLDDDKRSYGSYGGIGSRGFGFGGRRGLNGRGYGGYNYDSDGPRRSAHDKDGETYGHENSPHESTEFGEKDGPRGDDYDYGFNIGRGYGNRRHQELDLDDDKRSYGGYGYGGYGGYGRRGLSFGRRGGYGYDSDGPRRSAHDKDGETYGHENGPHQRTEFGEKDGPRGDDRDYGYNAGARSYGYGNRRHQELDLDDDKRSYGGYGAGLNRGYGRRSSYGGY